MKVILISLPAPFEEEPAMNPPLGLCYILSYLKSKSIDAEILDFTLFKNYDYYKNDYLKEIPLDADFYGIFSTSALFYWLHEVSKYLKENSDGLIVAGGPHPSTMPKQTLEDTDVDFVVKGDGEIPMYLFATDHNPKEIPGVSYRKGNKIIEQDRYYQTNLDILPLPIRPNIEKYKRLIKGEKAVHIVTLRGCPFNCAFCDRVSVGRNVRYRSVENVLKEIDEIIEQHEIRSFVIYDDIFTLIKDRTKQFCEEFKKRKLQWRCWSRVDIVNKEILEIMRDSGMTSITFGVESGDDGILKNIRKGTSYEKNKNALLLCKELNIPMRCSLMYGNPGETLQTLKNTIKLVKETQPDEWNLSVLTPVPGSDIWDYPEKYGVVFDKDWVIKNKFIMTHRLGDSGIGNVWVSLKSMNNKEFVDNLKYFVDELERVCPRKKIQDTIQNINVGDMIEGGKNG